MTIVATALTVTRPVKDRRNGHVGRPGCLWSREGAVPACSDMASWGAVSDLLTEIVIMDGLVLHTIVATMDVLPLLIGSQ